MSTNEIFESDVIITMGLSRAAEQARQHHQADLKEKQLERKENQVHLNLSVMLNRQVWITFTQALERPQTTADGDCGASSAFAWAAGWGYRIGQLQQLVATRL